MLTKNELTNEYVVTNKTVTDSRHWTIAANGKPLDSVFKKTISVRATSSAYKQAGNYSILKDDLIQAMELYYRHAQEKELPEIITTLRYVHGTEPIMHTLLKARVTNWSESGDALSMEISFMNLKKEKQHNDYDEEQHKLILEGVNAGIWDLDVKTGKIWCSDKVYALLGYKRNEIDANYQTFLHYLHPADVQRTTKMITSRVKASSAYINDIRFKHKDGTYHWFELAGKIKLAKNGRPARIVGSLINKDQRRRLLTELERYQFLIDESTALINAGSWEINFVNDTLTWSAAMCSIHETGDDYRPLIRNLFQFLQERDRIYFKQLLKDAYHNGKAYDATFESVTAKGNLKWIRMIGKPVINDDGSITTIRGITQDIHEQTLKDEKIKHSFDVITAKNESLSNFAHIVSHNLKSHAGNMESILKLIDYTNDADEQKELLGYLKKISNNLNQTIEHLSETVRVQHNIGIKKSLLHLNTTLNNVLDVLRPTINETNAIIISDTSAYNDIEYIPAYLESIILNLVSNALKYRRPNTQPIIEIKAFIENGKKCLSVKDNGAGIDLKANGHKIFGMYKTFHSNPDAVGIGLFITRNQVEALGGSITVESKPSKGSTFIVTF